MTGIGREFMEKTKYQHLAPSHQDLGLPQPPLQVAVPADAVFIELPPIEQIKVKEMDLRTAMAARRSRRKYARPGLTLAELAYLLWSTQGVQQVTDRPSTLRPVPSAGARHALETYLLINRVEGLEPGLYRYVALGHKLLAVDLGAQLAWEIARAAGDQPFLAESAVTFLWAVDIYRMTWRYGERGYRYILLDAGHVCQNLYLASTAIDCGVCAVAAFDDDELNKLLGLDGEQHFVVYLAAVGKTAAQWG